MRALLEVDEGSNIEEALARQVPDDAADRALAWNIAMGVLRNRPALDAGISMAAKRAVWTLDAGVLATLRVAAYELAFTRTPPHAAVNEAVEVSRAVGVGHAGGFVNAVLRRVEVPKEGDVSLGFPEWMVTRWRARWGSEVADTYLRACAEPAGVCIVAKEDPGGLAASFQHAGLPLLPVADGVFRLPARAGRVDELPGFVEGRFWVMDLAAVAVADLLADALPEGAEVLDACAAPGGKSFRLASRGFAVTATDLSTERLTRVVSGSARLGLSVATSAHDWLKEPLSRTFAGVLVDAPCTALGLVRRHPEIRWRREERDIEAAGRRQAAILANAARCVAPGGVIVYAVCSPEPEEGRAIAETLGWPIEASFENAGNPEGSDIFSAYRMRSAAG